MHLERTTPDLPSRVRYGAAIEALGDADMEVVGIIATLEQYLGLEGDEPYGNVKARPVAGVDVAMLYGFRDGYHDERVRSTSSMREARPASVAPSSERVDFQLETEAA